MHNDYDDIISRINTPPIWFDEYSVPRYCEFEPQRSPSIHINEIALVEITCQRCKRRFLVALSVLNFTKSKIAEAVRNKTLHYGDPPWHYRSSGAKDDRCTGNSMNSEPRRVIEYWSRGDKKYVVDSEIGQKIANMAYFDWLRDASLEIDIQPIWVKD
jgi:hypothetical protein